MKRVFLIVVCALLAVGGAWAQAPGAGARIETAFGFDWAVSSDVPGHCGCFSMTGARESVAINIRPSWALVGQVADVWQSNVGQSGFRLNVGSVLAGGRYRLRAHDRISWFGQVLAGTVHMSGNAVYRPLYTFAVQPGVGLDIALSPHVAFRPFEIDLLHTDYLGAHGQLYFHYGVGLVFRFGGAR